MPPDCQYIRIDSTCVAHRRQPVRDDDGGAPEEQALEGALDPAPGVAVGVGGGLVEHQDLPIGDECAGIQHAREGRNRAVPTECPAAKVQSSQGLMTSIPQYTKSLTFRVARPAPRDCTIPAIMASNWLIGRPAFFREDAIRA